ncbi:MAG TPA: hypothetical protein VK589_24300 [Chryseolinea sp.]|nr:hypothetical protein [Chryseolinea sp.]
MKKIEELKTFEDACTVLKLNAKKVLPDFSCYPKQDHAAMQAHAKLVIIARAANRLANKGKEWKPNWGNSSQWKYYPWFEMNGSSGFRFSGGDGWASTSNVGSRLCVISREVAVYIGKQFEDLYKDYFTL